MQRWEAATEEFLIAWRRRRAVIGALACGSHVTGHPTPRSDIDVQILLAPGTKWRERGNRIVDGFLIEYFANSAKQNLAYFEADHAGRRRITATMFVTGRVVYDPNGELRALVAEARRWQRKPFKRMPASEREPALYSLWDAVDNLLDAADRRAPDLPFQYHHAVALVYDTYARFLGQPVLQVDRIFSTFRRGGRPERYLLDPFPDAAFIAMLLRAIREKDPARMPRRLERLSHYVQDQMGGFEIDGWTFRTPSV